MKKAVLAGLVAAMVGVGVYAYYALEREESLSLPSNAKVRRLVRELKRQVQSFCIYFVKDTRTNLKAQATP
jgi:hypothetical protein